jgi:DNA-binding NarL/FixJ family response regulator
MDLSLECRQAGADGFILKPYMPEELVEKIRETIENE